MVTKIACGNILIHLQLQCYQEPLDSYVVLQDFTFDVMSEYTVVGGSDFTKRIHFSKKLFFWESNLPYLLAHTSTYK